jgi:MoxR-like ATPase
MSTTVTQTQLEPEILRSRIERFRQVQSEIVRQVRRVIVGQEEVLEQVMISLFVQTLGLVFKRIQFTPDLMPSDITGTDIIEEDPATGHRTWTFVQGPIFSR